MREISKEYKQSNNYTTATDLFKTYDNKFNIDRIDFMLIVKVFFKSLTYSAVNSGKVYSIPGKLGIFGIGKRVTIGRGAFDYQLYKEQGLKVWRKNTHSSMYAGKIFWKTLFPRFYVNTIYPNNIFKFAPCREFSRYLSKQIKEQNTISKYYDY